MFEAGDREGARVQYRRALDLGEDDPACRALYADTILWQGDFAAARREFEIAASSNLPFAGLGQLISGLVEDLWGEEQERNAEAAEVRLREIQVPAQLPDPDAVVSVLNLDALNPVAWHLFALGRPRSEATKFHVAAAWLARRVPEYWVRAAMSSLAQRGSDRLTHEIISVGHRFAGDLLEVGADGLADLHLNSADATEREEAEADLASQLLALRELISDIGRERRRQGILRAAAE
jgi:hypothetical protein